MKTLFLAAFAVLIPVAAQADARYYSPRLSCAKVKSIVEAEGSAVMRWQSQRVLGLPRYERLVSDSGFCHENEYAAVTTVPTADDPECWVKHCEFRLNDDGGIIIPGG